MSEGEQRIAQLAQSLLAYLHAHPAAVDSLRGVRQCWFGDCEPEPSSAEVQGAIEHLVQQGQVRRIYLADGSQVFGRGRELGAWGPSPSPDLFN